MVQKKRGQVGPRFIMYILGLLIMSLGIVLLIKAALGATPWDVFHVGLFLQLGLTIGSWSIIVGVFILLAASIISKELPQIGALLNMLLVGVFIDLYLLLPVIKTPISFLGKTTMLVSGIILIGYGMGLYISAGFGAGPRDSLMIALTSKTGWKIGHVRSIMEIIVLMIGWLLGGPVSIGTVIFTIVIGPIASIAIPQCEKFTNTFLKRLKKRQKNLSLSKQHDKSINRGANV
ncbi:YitT family protein [Bacillus aquiflavi]|uniref:YitT family protein n=1 Tax=Bacillus aquiflavi TaxID=2672567 RepID=A0A6B3W0T7_9BACI|nr:YitT family protein [Bacillus aquiflavi]MBA4538438.1 YitT family protein [Bacillus aquiflavi]NEY82802.1 YitT family protein [Bacillus aquiflavi]